MICFALGHNKCLLEGDNKNLLDRMWAACACTCMCVHVTACSQLCFIVSGGKLLEVCWEHLEIYKTTTKKAFHPLSQPPPPPQKKSFLPHNFIQCNFSLKHCQCSWDYKDCHPKSIHPLDFQGNRDSSRSESLERSGAAEKEIPPKIPPTAPCGSCITRMSRMDLNIRCLIY